MLWQGTATDTLSDKPKKNEKKINNALDDMFKKFPPQRNSNAAYTYGVGAVYSPWYGGYAVGRSAYGPYGAAGSSAWYNPATGRYGRSAVSRERTAAEPWPAPTTRGPEPTGLPLKAAMRMPNGEAPSRPGVTNGSKALT